MTREEAIEYLKRADTTVGQTIKTRTAEALEMAIEALQTEPCQDCISRQAAYQKLSLLLSDWDDDYNKVISKCLQAIDNVPSVQPEQKIGHWIMTGDYYIGAYGSIDYVRCSCCHEDSLEEGDYCPNCGAKMEEGE